MDKAFQSVGVDEMLHKGGFTLNSSHFIGGLVKWFLVIVFLIASLEILGLSQVNDFLKNVVLGYLPNVIVAALILVVAAHRPRHAEDSGRFYQSTRGSFHPLLGRINQVVHLDLRHFAAVSIGNRRSFRSNFIYRFCGYGDHCRRIGFRFGRTGRGFQIHRTS